MPSNRTKDLRFPLGGVNRRHAHTMQAPYTAPDAMNVWPFGQDEERVRGGSRAGVTKAIATQVGSGGIRMLNVVQTTTTGTNTTTTESSLIAGWDVLAGTSPTITDELRWDGTYIATPATPGTALYYGNAADSGFLTASTFAYNQDYTITVDINAIGNGQWVSIFTRLDNTTPDVDDSGVVEVRVQHVSTSAQTTLTIADGVNTDSSLSWINGPGPQAILKAVYHANGTVEVTYTSPSSGTRNLTHNAPIHGAASTTVRVGMVLRADAQVTPTSPTVNSFTMEHSLDTANTVAPIVASGSTGAVWWESTPGTMADEAGALSVSTDRHVMSGPLFSTLYIADHGDDVIAETATFVFTNANPTVLSKSGVTLTGVVDTNDHVCIVTASDDTATLPNGTYEIGTITDLSTDTMELVQDASSGSGGTCTIQIVVAPKKFVISGASGTLSLWRTSDSAKPVPSNCPIMAVHGERVYLAGDPANPQVFTASRLGDPTDFDLSVSETDPARAFAGVTADDDTGGVGQPIMALCPHFADYMVLGTASTLWIIRGDIAYGGSMENLSYEVGIIGRTAWCRTDNGEMYFLSQQGLYKLPTNPNSGPQAVSKDLMPRELLGIDQDVYEVTVTYDHRFNGVFVFLAPKSPTNTPIASTEFWFFHIPTGGIWPCQMDNTVGGPYASTAYASTNADNGSVLYGGNDGYIRSFNLSQIDDDGSDFSSFVEIGPLMLGGNNRNGVLNRMDCHLGEQSGNVSWAVRVADTAEGLASAADFTTGTFVAGKNYTQRPRARGEYGLIKLSSTGSSSWQFEKLVARYRMGGRAKSI